MAGRGATRDVPLTEFVRMRIREWERSGRSAIDLEQRAGCARGYVTKIRSGQSGISARSGEGFARAFGFDSYETMLMAAYDWWRTTGKASVSPVLSPEAEPDQGKREAIAAAKALSSFSDDLLRHVFALYPDVRGKPALWWLERASEEAADFHRAREQRIVEGKASKAKARELTDARKEAPASSTRSVAGEAPRKNGPEKPKPKRRSA